MMTRMETRNENGTGRVDGAGGDRGRRTHRRGTIDLAPAAKAGPRVVVAETTSIEARLDAVDVKTRLMTVTGPRGKTLTLKVGPR